MSDTKPSMPGQPAEKPTVKFEPPPDWAIAMKEQMENGFRGLRADISMVANDIGLVRDRVVILERWKVESDERSAKHSGGLTRSSEVDAKHDAAIASIIEKQDALATQVDTLTTKTDAQTLILQRLEAGAKELVKNPKVQLLAGILWTALLGYLASKGLVAR